MQKDVLSKEVYIKLYKLHNHYMIYSLYGSISSIVITIAIYAFDKYAIWISIIIIETTLIIVWLSSGLVWLFPEIWD